MSLFVTDMVKSGVKQQYIIYSQPPI